MRALENNIAVVRVVLFWFVLTLAACGAKPSSDAATDKARPAPAPVEAVEGTPAAPVTTESAPAPPPSPAPVPVMASRSEHITRAMPPTRPSPPAAAVPIIAPPAPSPEPGDDAAVLIQRVDAYLGGLKTAAYTFNPPSPILVAKPVTVHLWLDPQTTTDELAAELKKVVPRDAARVESGETRWSPKMHATLSGPDFEIKAIDPEEQLVSSTQRTTWSWDVTPLRAGEGLALHLRLAAVLPPELGPPKTITTLDREINVDVTWWWLFDHYFEKYWKWLLGGLGTALTSVIAWWWKNRQASDGKSGT